MASTSMRQPGAASGTAGSMNGFTGTVTLSPATRTVMRGGSAFTTLTSTVSGGFTGALTLSVTGLPSASTATFTLRVTAANGSTTRRTTVTLTVR